MKGPGIKDYLEVIENMKVTAQKEGRAFIEVNSKELHANVSPDRATMPTYYQVIYKLMLEDDEILRRLKGDTGFGSHLTVCFYVEQLEGRERMFPNKKHGRPAKSEEEKLAARKARMKGNTEDLCNLIRSRLGGHGWEYIENKDLIETHNESQRQAIGIQGIKRGRKQALLVKLNEVLEHIEDINTRYSIASNGSVSYCRQWNEIPKAVGNSLNMSVILANKKGNATEL